MSQRAAIPEGHIVVNKQEWERLQHLHATVHEAGEKLRRIDYDSVFCSMTCDEAEALAEVFAAAGDLATAQHIITGHGHGDDDPEDDHHHIWLKRKEH